MYYENGVDYDIVYDYLSTMNDTITKNNIGNYKVDHLVLNIDNLVAEIVNIVTKSEDFISNYLDNGYKSNNMLYKCLDLIYICYDESNIDLIKNDLFSILYGDKSYGIFENEDKEIKWYNNIDLLVNTLVTHILYHIESIINKYYKSLFIVSTPEDLYECLDTIGIVGVVKNVTYNIDNNRYKGKMVIDIIRRI